MKFDSFIKFLKTRKKIIIFLLLIINITALIGLFRLKINTSFDLFFPKDSSYKTSYDRMMKEFDTDEQVIVVFEFNKDILTVQGLKKILKINNKLSKFDVIKKYFPPIPKTLLLNSQRLELKDVSADNIESIKKAITQMNDFINIKEKNGKYYALYTLFTEKMDHHVIGELEDTLKGFGYKYYITGNSFLQYKMFDYLLFLLLTAPPLAMFLIFLIFLWRIGSVKGTVLSLLPAIFGAIWTMGLLSYLNIELSMMTILVPIFVIVLGSADGLHFVSHFIDNRESVMSKEDAVKRTLSSVGIALIMTTITTMAGFASLAVFKSRALAQMGILSAIGIAFAGIATWLILPLAFLEIDDIKKKKQKNLSAEVINTDEISEDYKNHINNNKKADKLLNILKYFRGAKAIIISIVLVLLFIPGIFLVKTEFNITSIYKNYTSVKKDINLINKVFGSALPVFAVFESTDDIIMPDTAQKIIAIEKRIAAVPGVNKVFSYYDIISFFNSRMFKQKGYPTDPMDAMILYKGSSAMRNITDNIFNRDSGYGRIIIFPENLKSETLKNIEKAVAVSGSLKVEVTGLPYIMKDMNDTLIKKQVKSIIIAVLLVFFMVLIFQRSLRIAVITTLPISMTMLILFGFMGYAGIELSIITGIMASIVIGVGIDYGIHFSGLYSFYVKQKDHDPVSKAFDDASTPIIANAMGFAIGFSAYLLSPFQIHTYLSLIMWVTMFSSAFLSLTLLPALLSFKRSSSLLHF